MALSQADLNQFHGLLAAPTQKVTPKSKGNMLTHLLPTIGGTGGGVLGGAAGGALAGSVILPGVGTVAGGLLGALLGGAGGGALGKVAENKIEGNGLGQGVAGEAVTNGVLSAGPLRLLKGAGALTKGVMSIGKEATPGLAESLLKTGVQDAGAPLKTSMAGKLDAFGNKQLGKNWGTLDSPTRKATNPAQTVSDLSNMGVMKPEDAERIASKFTGSNGLVNQAVVKAVGETTPVSINGIKTLIPDAIIQRNLHGLPQAKTAEAFINSQLTKLGDNPTSADVFKSMKRFEKQASDLEGAGGNYKRVDPTRGDVADVYRDVRSHLEDALYKGAGVDKNLSTVLTPELKSNLLSLHPNNPQWEKFVNDKVMNAQSVKDLRSAQAPFVNARKMVDNAADNQFSAGGQMVNNTSGLKGLFLDGAANTIAKPVRQALGTTAKNLAKSAPGSTGGASGLLSALTAPTKKSIIRNEALIGAPLSLMNGGQVSADGMDSGAPAGQPTALSPELMSGGTDQPQASTSPFDPSNVQQGVQAILANGGKMSDVTAYVSLVKAMQDLGGSGGKAATPNATQQQQANNALSGLQSIQDIASTLQSNPNAAKLSALPGGSLTSALTGTGQYKAAITNAVDVIGRLRSGGAIGQEEEKQFKALLPQAFDTPDTAAYKLNQLQVLFNRFANPTAAASDLSTNGVALN